MSHPRFLPGNTGNARKNGEDGRPQGATHRVHPAPVPTMTKPFPANVHSRDGGRAVRWVAPCGRPSSSAASFNLNSLV